MGTNPKTKAAGSPAKSKAEPKRDPAVPAVRAVGGGASTPAPKVTQAPTAPIQPQVPGPDAISVDVGNVMRAIITYNNHYLREKLKSNSHEFFYQFSDMPLHEHAIDDTFSRHRRHHADVVQAPMEQG